MTKNKLMAHLAAALLSTGAVSAQALEAQGGGTWLVNGGVMYLKPNTESGTLTSPSPPNTTVDISDDTQPTVAVTYMLNDHWSVELPLGLGFEHDIEGTGSIAGVGKVASVKVLPATVFLQYRFGEPTARVRPYAMLGATYAYFYDEQGSAALNGLNPLNPIGGQTGLSVKSKFAATPGVGVTVRINERWFVDAQYAHSFLTTTSTLSTGQSIETKLDPDLLKLGIGLSF